MEAPYTVNIDQQAARHYADKGATFLLLDVPEQTHIAFDHQASLRALKIGALPAAHVQALNAWSQSFVVGPKFKGVKMLPPGTHMVSYNAASRTGDFAPTSSFFVHLAPSQVYVRKWSTEQELLFELPADEVMLAFNCTNSATNAVLGTHTLQQSCTPCCTCFLCMFHQADAVM